MQDYLGNTVLSINDNIAPRVGVIFDPARKARAKIFAHYGATTNHPDELAARGFAGVGGFVRVSGPRSAAPVRSSQAARC